MRKTIISLFIACMITLQFFSSLGYFRYYMWPFLDYPMYRKVYNEGALSDDITLYGVFSDGSETEITKEDLKLNFGKFQRLLRYIRDGKVEEVRTYSDLYQKLYQKRIIMFRVENHAFELRKEGFTRIKEPIISKLELE